MPVEDANEAFEVERHIERIFAATSTPQRAAAIRAMFVEKLDFNPASGQVSLAGTPASVKLPNAAERIAQLDGVHVLYVALHIPETDRVRKAEAAAAARLIADQLGEDLLLIFTNTSRTQLHFIHPDFDSAQPTLRRMVVERDLPRRTAVEQFSKVYWSYERSGRIRAALEEAFDVEPVTKLFFQEYKRVFEAAEAQVSGFGSSKDEQDAKRLFVQTLFNRLMFVYFLSRKGWLTFRGDNDYLNALWKDYYATPLRINFYTSRLAPLFFAGLNNPQSRNLNRDNPALHGVIGDVPFLNGGLFEETELDRRDGVTVPDGAIEPVLSDLFDKFNFTVMESTPFDIEVAVDPEMLGKVFEELVTGRHESGSYYTPRPVVSFMCRESLKGYLESQEFGAPPEAIQMFVDRHKIGGISDHAHGVREALAKVRVVDPACGSGAYLLGMMQELVDLRTSLDSEELRRNPRYLYDLKLHIIQRNLYGVDIDEFAVNIAMLRMWLSLAIEYEGQVPEPLPNLDFKVVCGDSLLGPDPSPENLGDLFRHQVRGVAGRLTELKAKYMDATGPNKDTIKREIESTQKQLAAALADSPAPEGSADWRVQFAEVFAERGGFDVVIANPPYVRQEQIGNLKTDLAMRFPLVYQGTADILVYFFGRAIELMRPGGWLVFITSNKYMRAAYGKKLRGFLRDSLIVRQVMDFGDLPVFAATSYPAVLVGRKGTAGDDHQMRVADLTRPVHRALKDRGLSVTPETVNRAMDGLPDLLDRHGHPNYPQALLRPSGWTLEDPALIRLFERLMNQGTPLGEYVDGRVYRGVTTGLNDAFVIDRSTRDALVAADPKSAEIIKPWLRGKDIKRWSSRWVGLYLIFARRGVEIECYPAICDYLTQFRYPVHDPNGKVVTKGLEPRGGVEWRKRGRYKWYELQDTIDYYIEFDQPKIIWKKTSFKPAFTWDDSGAYLANTVHLIAEAKPWLCALFNSSVYEFLMALGVNLLRGGYIELTPDRISPMPIPSLSTSSMDSLSAIAENGQSCSIAKDETVNGLVLDAFGVDTPDRQLIGDYLARRSELRPVDGTPGTRENY